LPPVVKRDDRREGTRDDAKTADAQVIIAGALHARHTQTHGQTYIQTHGHTQRHTDRQTDRLTDRPTRRQGCRHIIYNKLVMQSAP